MQHFNSMPLIAFSLSRQDVYNEYAGCNLGTLETCRLEELGIKLLTFISGISRLVNGPFYHLSPNLHVNNMKC